MCADIQILGIGKVLSSSRNRERKRQRQVKRDVCLGIPKYLWNKQLHVCM